MNHDPFGRVFAQPMGVVGDRRVAAEQELGPFVEGADDQFGTLRLRDPGKAGDGPDGAPCAGLPLIAAQAKPGPHVPDAYQRWTSSPVIARLPLYGPLDALVIEPAEANNSAQHIPIEAEDRGWSEEQAPVPVARIGHSGTDGESRDRSAANG